MMVAIFNNTSVLGNMLEQIEAGQSQTFLDYIDFMNPDKSTLILN